MSRIGKRTIPLPQGVELSVDDSVVSVKGPKGLLKVVLPKNVSAVIEGEPAELAVKVTDSENMDQKALWGLFRQLIANAVAGVQKPFQKSLEFVGVGFKVALEGKLLKMEVGFSHPVVIEVPEGLEAMVEKQVLTISGIDKQAVGEFAARIRRVKPPEPYKGKGIKYTDEVIRRKAGKTATKS